VTRDEALKKGVEIVDQLDLACRSRRVGLLDVNGTILSVPLAMRTVLAQRLADELQTPGNALPAEGLRGHLYRIRRDAERIYSSVAPAGRRFAKAARTARRILIVPRSDNHLRDLLPVRNELKARRDVDVRWIFYRRDMLARVAEIGDGAILVDPAWPAPRLLAEANRAVAAEGLPANVARVAAETFGFVLPEVQASIRTFRRAMASLRPSLVVVGNPCTFEGRLAIAAARGARARTATIQHGWMIPDDPLWRNVPFDLICTWGTRARTALLATGVDESRIAVTGAPWLDGFRSSRRAGDAPTILVALSGPGHLVGVAEHEEFVTRIYRAAAELPSYRWIFRLHPKDDPATYARIAHKVPDARAEVMEARKTGVTIHDQLRTAAVLITGKSASAIDAMIAGVPVATVGRPPGELVPDFVSAGATTHVTPEMSLSLIVRSLIEEGQSEQIAARAREYVTSFYGEGEHATRRVATRLEELMG
jgi:hypothetical protein